MNLFRPNTLGNTRFRSRPRDSRICSAVVVHLMGVGFSSQFSTRARTSASNAWAEQVVGDEAKRPLVRVERVGVKCMWKQG